MYKESHYKLFLDGILDIDSTRNLCNCPPPPADYYNKQSVCYLKLYYTIIASKISI